jgi:CRISPR-associated protein Csd1
MILTSLVRLYQRLLANPDPNSGMARVPPYGFTEERIGHVLVLSRAGDLVDVLPNFVMEGDKLIAGLVAVPWSFDRTGSFTEKAFAAGKNPAFFLWDKPEYLLGVSLKDKKLGTIETSDLPFRAFQKLHRELLSGAQDEGLFAVLSFLNVWVPERFGQSNKLLPKMLETNFTFKLDGDVGLICHRPAAQTVWLEHVTRTQSEISVPCLISNEIAPLKMTHPKIKGVWGGQSSGGAIVSFNEDAYSSYGKSQGENAPISETAAFAYTTALNFLLRRANGQCLSIGDTSTVFWAESVDSAKTAHAENIFNLMLNMPSGDTQEQAKIRPVLESISRGKPLDQIAPSLASGTRFFVLGLAPNAARLSIRYWFDTSFGELAQHIAQHFEDLALEPPAWREPPSLWSLLIQTAPLGESKNISSRLAGEFLRAMITGQRYPRILLTHVVQRIRADGEVNGLRAVLIKAVLVRDFRKNLIGEEVPMALDEKNIQPAYRLGRLFAVLERIQQGALGKDVNATITDRYYGTASAVPYSVFPRLLSGSKHHISKIRKDMPGYAFNLEKDLGNVIDGLESQFPKQLSIEQQGQFAIGYYQQKQFYFAKKATSELAKHADSSDAAEPYPTI